MNCYSKLILTLFCIFALTTAEAQIENTTLSNPPTHELLPEEKKTIEIFQKASPKVVYVHRMHQTRTQGKFKAGAGSGIIWDAQGHIVTNFHVIKDAPDLAITLGGITVPAKVLGKEPRKDLAVLAITDKKALDYLKNFQPFTIVNSKDLIVGQKAIAIGNPFGLDHSLTVGVISALGRKVPGIGGVSIRGMIQTDASVNPGNSGGPLLDSAGRLIGINTMIFSHSGTSTGVGFVVPADDIERTVTQIIKHGRVELAGIGIHSVEPNLARRLGVKKGLLIGEVMRNTPAAKAGLRGTNRNEWGQVIKGDIIIGLNGHDIPDYDNLYNLLTKIKIGDPVDLTIMRHGKKMHLKIQTIDIAAV